MEANNKQPLCSPPHVDSLLSNKQRITNLSWILRVFPLHEKCALYHPTLFLHLLCLVWLVFICFRERFVLVSLSFPLLRSPPIAGCNSLHEQNPHINASQTATAEERWFGLRRIKGTKGPKNQPGGWARFEDPTISQTVRLQCFCCTTTTCAFCIYRARIFCARTQRKSKLQTSKPLQ